MSENNCHIREEYYSLYVPAIRDMTQEQISRVFWEKCVGIVSRVDYFKKSSGMLCAFVHFESINNNNEIVNTISNEILIHGSYQLWFNDREYLILMPMTCKKIPETHLNIHQLALKIAESDDRILYLENCILKLEEIILKQNKESLKQRMFLEGLRHAEMEQMVTSLVGPRWTHDDEVDATSPIFVSYNESKVDDDSSIFETR
jgi:hypothetical protein